MGAKHDIFFKIAVPAGYSIKMGPDGKKYVAYKPTDVGTVDHAALESNLAWADSGHTGTASSIATFDAQGDTSVISFTEGTTDFLREDGTFAEPFSITYTEGTTDFLREDGTFAEPPGTAVAGTDNIGYQNVPQNSQSADYTTVLSDSGKHIYHPDYSSFANAYATLNPSNKNASITLSNGNLTATNDLGGLHNIFATLGKTTGKWYWEVTCIFVQPFVNHYYGVTKDTTYDAFGFLGDNTNAYSYAAAGNLYHNQATDATPDTFNVGDVIGIALDLDNGTIDFYKNNVHQGNQYTGLSGTFYPAFSMENTNDSLTANFGAVEFAYTPPTGFLGLYTEVETEHAPNTYTIASNASVAYPNGSVIAFVNDALAGDVTIAIDSDTLVLAGAGTTGSRTLAANGMATAIKIGTTRWLITGTNLT